MEITLPSQENIREVLGIRKYLYVPVLVLIIVVALVGFVIVPNVRFAILVGKELKVTRTEIESLEGKASLLESLDEDELLGQIEALERALPSKKAVFDLLQSLNGLGSQTGIALENFSLTPGSLATAAATPSASEREQTASTKTRGRAASPPSKLRSLDFSVDIFGSYEGVNEFLDNLESLAPLMKLTRLTLSPYTRSRFVSTESAISVSFEVNGSIEMSMFYAILPTQLGKITDKLEPLSERELELYEEVVSLVFYETTAPVVTTGGKEDLFAPF